MGVEAKNGLRSNLRFSKALGPDTHQEITDTLAKIARGKRAQLLTLNEKENPSFTERQLSEKENQTVVDYLNRAKLTMVEMGLTEAEASLRLPPTSQIIFRNDSRGNGGFCDAYGQYMWIHLMPDQAIQTIRTAEIVYHETGHFVTDKVLGSYNGYHSNFGSIKLKLVSDGLDTSEKNNFRRRGLYGESLSTLFSLDCISDSIVLKTDYTEHTPFIISFLEAFTRRKGTEAVAAYRELFKAHVTADYNFYREIVACFGIETVKGLNTIAQHDSNLDKKVLNSVAQIGGFHKEYVDLREAFESGDTIGLNGLKGGFKMATPAKTTT